MNPEPRLSDDQRRAVEAFRERHRTAMDQAVSATNWVVETQLGEGGHSLFGEFGKQIRQNVVDWLDRYQRPVVREGR